MKLADQLTSYISAAFTGIWIETREADEAEREIVQHARKNKWKIAVWDVASGLRVPGANATGTEAGAGDPLAALRALPALADEKGTAILVLHNFHRFLTSAEVVQTAFAQLVAGKQQRTFIVVLAPSSQIPVELEKLFVVIEHALPDHDQLERIARELTSDRPGDLPTGDDLQRVLDAAAGLTRYEAEGAFALSLTKHNAFVPRVIWDLKAQMLRKNNLLRLHQGSESFESLGGLPNLKDFCRRALQAGKSVKPRGLLLLGVPGSGKSCFAKAPRQRNRSADAGARHGRSVRLARRCYRSQCAPGPAHRRRDGAVHPLHGRTGKRPLRRRRPRRRRRFDQALWNLAHLVGRS